MNHLMTFDIANIQEDYSYVMECIALLENKSFDKIGKIINEKMQGKFHRTTSSRKFVAPRYFECPQNVFIKEIDNKPTFRDKKEIYEEYYKVLHSKGLNSMAYDTLSKIIYVNDENKCYKPIIPHALMSHFFINNTSKTELSKAIDDNKVFYHIRIVVNTKELYNLQYLGLLLKKFNLLVKNKRLSAVLLCEELPLNYFPFCNPVDKNEVKKINETYKLFSSYLRLLAQENTGVIFAPKYENDEPIISPMNYMDSSVGNIFFPLMEIGFDEYSKLFGITNYENNHVLSSQIKKENLYQSNSANNNKYSLFQTGKTRFYNADDRKPNEALIAFVAETAWKRLRKNWFDGDVFSVERFSCSREKIIDNFTKEKNNWLTFAIFSFIFSGTDINKSMNIRINECYQIAREISNGLQQIIQNAIQHSEEQSCFFTFYVDEQSNQLKIFVSDINTKDTLIGNFEKQLKKEISYCESINNIKSENAFNYKTLIRGHNNLIDNNIALRHFFNVFRDDEEKIRNYWKIFRQSDSTAHVGLLIFYQTIIHCCANLRLQSSKDYYIDSNGNNIFIHSPVDSIKDDQFDISENIRIVPGTQYLMGFPINKWNINNSVGEASISNIGSFSEDYATFAKYIDYKTSELDTTHDIFNVLTKIEKYTILSSDDKFKIQLIWTDFWNKYFSCLNDKANMNCVYVLRIKDNVSEYLSHSDNVEVFFKGLFGALNSEFNVKIPIYFALVNLPVHCLECLRDLCISFSNRLFPENIQMFFVDSTYKKHIQIFGNSFLDIICNATNLGIEHGSTVFRFNDITNAYRMTLSEKNNVVDDESRRNGKPIAVMPFDVIVSKNENSKETIFDAYLFNLVKKRMDISNSQGYKLENTHMRLGSKVHIQSFYEMSFLFYRTTIANRIAFKILRSYVNIIQKKINKEKFSVSPILFYSYASYSKAILTSIVEITREYIKKFILDLIPNIEDYTDYKIKRIINTAQSQVAFASYQHNLQSETNNDSIQLYFGIPEKYSGAKMKVDVNNKGRSISLNNNIDVILIVPISSTLTTFDKMFSKLKEHTICNNYDLFLSDNYTVLWVCDKTNYNDRLLEQRLYPSDIERNYWKYADMKQQLIETNIGNQGGLIELENCSQINFFVCVNAYWEHPLVCSLCFPNENQLIREVPLVETDSTSTVPSQQIREEVEENTNFKNISWKRKEERCKKNNYRLELLRDCVYYGHIQRSKNHYQYYINSQDFFYKNKVQKDIRNWLMSIRKNEHTQTLKIIFSPEHNTNVGFAQYVNTYYFGGTAEVISINEDKVFRSNFICEHEMLRQTIERIHIQKDLFQSKEPVEFYFVDDNINTGETIHKANSLLKSLIPKEYAYLYPAFLFKECFVLIDRLSDASKSSYILSGDTNNFHSYVHIDISNMRVHGDSCVGCKLQKDAAKLFKRSASRITASYWANKYERLQAVDYDNFSEMECRKKKMHAYERMILSHIVQNYVFDDAIFTRKKGEYYDAILFMFKVILEFRPNDVLYQSMLRRNHFYYFSLVNSLFDYEKMNYSEKTIDEVKLNLAELLMKILSRPFFSFDYSFRLQMQSFLLIIAECYLSYYSNDENKIIEFKTDQDINKRKINVKLLENMIPKEERHKQFLREKNRLYNTVEIARIFMRLHADSPIVISNFFKEILFEALADMRSTYLLRKKVIVRVSEFVNNYLSNDAKSGRCNGEECSCENLLDSKQCKNKTAKRCFWISYLAHVQRIIDCSADENKAIWFEYLILSGNEMNDCKEINIDYNDMIGIEKYISPQCFPIAAEFFLTTATTGFDTTEKIIETNSKNKYFLNNYYMIRQWKKQNNTSNNAHAWHQLLERNEAYSNQTDIDMRYEEFLDNLVDYISELNFINKQDINIALLTMPEYDKIKSAENVQSYLECCSVDKIQFVKERFGDSLNLNKDVKQERYVIKNHIANILRHELLNEKTVDIVSAQACVADNETINNSSVGILTENGYKIVFSNTIDNSFCCDNNYQKFDMKEQEILENQDNPYIVILFDNPNKVISNEKLGRKLVPLSPAFLYIGLNISDDVKRKKIPWLVLQDVLAYRNQILKFLTVHFNGNIMEKHAISKRGEAILSHERSASHASTTDEKGMLRVFGLENISQLNVMEYPIELTNGEIIKKKAGPINYYYSSELWLLLQNYVNNQIARLFSRQFNTKDKELIDNDGIPALYLSSSDEQSSNVFKRCLKEFGELGISPYSKKIDNRFKLLQHAANIYCDVDVTEKIFYQTENGKIKYYNMEYLFCIILDVIFTSLKYATVNDSLLPRVDNLIYYKKQKELLPLNCYKELPYVESHIFIFKDNDNLIILNNIKSNKIDKKRIQFINDEIYRRVHDPLDYGDGHMSLYTIKRFVEGIRGHISQHKDTSFRYVMKDKLKEKYMNYFSNKEYINIVNSYDIWFETKLPIFLEEQNNE